jgi:hypothetical protein
VRDLLLKDLERRIGDQRHKVSEDRRRIETTLAELPRKTLGVLGTREGLLVSFSAGIVAAGIAPSTSSVVLWDLFGRFALERMPDIRSLFREFTARRREASPDPPE